MAEVEVSVLVFSKDRPFQLGEYLRTLLLYSHGATLRVTVLAAISARFEASYAHLAEVFPEVDFWRETDFARQVEDNTVEEAVTASGEFLLFGVDDALFCNLLPLGAAADALRHEARLSCVHLKLSPGLGFSHPAGAVQHQPRMETLGEELAVFKGGDGSRDWNYPFELCGTLYRSALV
ncbi:hypothetical protein T484DRAFT_1808451 [Baffinella frigidus]|nr:hypothetical protein T484DRAFT_1808451 [Cryptophyta sp. CCMP2293]